MVKIIEAAYQSILNDQIRSKSISGAFDMCGLNPYAADTNAFDKHLDSLNENNIYSLLNQTNTSVAFKHSLERVLN